MKCQHCGSYKILKAWDSIVCEECGAELMDEPRAFNLEEEKELDFDED